MRFFKRIQQARRAGQRYDGPACFCDDYAAVPRPGFYALGPHPKTGQEGAVILADVPLVCVDDAPGDPDDGSCHYEYAGPKDNPYKQGDRIVSIEADEARGSAEVAM